MKKFGYLGFAAALALILAQTPAQADTKVKIGYLPTIDAMANYVAVDKGFFKKHGIDAELLLLATNAVIVPGVVSGDLQLGAVTVPILAQAVDNDIPIAAISGLAAYVKGYKGTAVVARRGLEVKRVQDMIGKRFLTGDTTSITTVIVRQWLQGAGIDDRQVSLIETPMSRIVDVLKSGSADLSLLTDPHLSRAVNDGVATIYAYVSDIVPDGTNSVIEIVSTDWAASNPEAIKGIKAALSEAGEWAKNNKDEALGIASKYLQMDVKKNTFPSIMVDLSVGNLQWWVDAMNAEKLLRTEFKAEKMLVK